jgi:DNA-3-methyladenine glycosylase I
MDSPYVITVYRRQPTCQRAIPTSPVLYSIERRIPINTDTLPEMPDDSATPTGLFTDDQQVTRCVWCRATPAYQHYHDQRVGVPGQDDERRLFEKICLEGFPGRPELADHPEQARKRFDKAFANFRRMDEVAKFGDPTSSGCSLDAGIVRHSGQDRLDHQQRPARHRTCARSLARWVRIVWRLEPALAADLRQHHAP